MAWYPKAIRREVTKHRTAMAAYRRLILHTAVSSASSLYGWHQQVSHASHFYLRHDGTWEQYVDTRYRAPNQMEGNHDAISVESQDMGGPFPSWSGSNVPAWTTRQTEAIAELAVWCHEVHGVPLVRLSSSKPGTRGIGWHRQGIDGNFPAPPSILAGRVSGGETWSQPGKVCPGDRRIEQIPGIITRAKQLAEGDDMPTVDEIADAVYDRLSREVKATHYAATSGMFAPGTVTRPNTGIQLGWVYGKLLWRQMPKLDAILAAIQGEDVVAQVRAELERHRAELVAELADDLATAVAAELADVPAEQVEAAVARALARTRLAVEPA